MTVPLHSAQVQKNESSVDLSCASLPSVDISMAKVVRGPWLQMGTDCSIVIRWDTDVATESVVSLGSSIEGLEKVEVDLTPSVKHEVEFIGLEPDTLYYYAVGDCSGIISGGDPSHRFKTGPRQGVERATRVWVIGDAGRASSEQREVYEAFEQRHQDRETDLWLMLGDNAYLDGTLEQYQEGVFDMYPSILRRAVVWPAFGNHDGRSADIVSETGPYFDLFTLPKEGEAGGIPSHHSAYYSFDYGSIHFVCLSSYEGDHDRMAEMMEWAKNDITSSGARWTIAFFHHPPYTKGSHDSDKEADLIEMRETVLPVLEAAGVDLVLTGHSHSYERSMLLNGHYGPSQSLSRASIIDDSSGSIEDKGPYQKQEGVPRGTVYVVAGTSGRADSLKGSHPAMYTTMSVLGSLLLDFDGALLSVRFIDEKGEVRDQFAMQKC